MLMMMVCGGNHSRLNNAISGAEEFIVESDARCDLSSQINCDERSEKLQGVYFQDRKNSFALRLAKVFQYHKPLVHHHSTQSNKFVVRSH